MRIALPLNLDDVVPSVAVGFKSESHIVQLLLNLKLETGGACSRDLVVNTVDVNHRDRSNNGRCSCTECLGERSLRESFLHLVDINTSLLDRINTHVARERKD